MTTTSETIIASGTRGRLVAVERVDDAGVIEHGWRLEKFDPLVPEWRVAMDDEYLRDRGNENEVALLVELVREIAAQP